MYESKIYVVSKTGQYETSLGMYWAEVTMIINLGYVPELEDIKYRYSRTKYFIYDDTGENPILEDMYGDPLVEIGIEALMRELRQVVRNGNTNSRVRVFLSTLESFNRVVPNSKLVCLHFGY